MQYSMMNAIVPCALALTTIALAADTAATEQHRPIEISDDGHIVIDMTEPAPSLGSIKRADAVPYGTAPDWQNTLRRQIGGLQVADMNGDSRPDVIAGCYQSGSFPPYDAWPTYIYYNTGTQLEVNPSFTSTDERSTGDIQVALINADPYPDIFAANGGSSYHPSVIYFGSATGPSTTPGWLSAEPSGAWNNYAMPFDYDHDGDMDVLTANQGNSQFDPYRPMYLFENKFGNLDTAPSWQTAETSIQNFIAFADYDDDGWEDFAVSKWANFETGIYRNVNGTLQTTPAWTTGDTDTDKGVAWADVDGNGVPDLALGRDPTWLYSNTDATLTQSWAGGASYYGHSDLRFADVDTDGDDDLVEVHFSNGVTNIYLNQGGTLDTIPSWSYDSSAVGTAIAFGDINGNGRLDLVIAYSGDPSIVVFYAEDFVCPADVTGDNQVNTDDFLAVLANWGACPAPCPPTCLGDTNDDCAVNTDDFLAVLAGWGPCIAP